MYPASALLEAGIETYSSKNKSGLDQASIQSASTTYIQEVNCTVFAKRAVVFHGTNQNNKAAVPSTTHMLRQKVKHAFECKWIIHVAQSLKHNGGNDDHATTIGVLSGAATIPRT